MSHAYWVIQAGEATRDTDGPGVGVSQSRAPPQSFPLAPQLAVQGGKAGPPRSDSLGIPKAKLPIQNQHKPLGNWHKQNTTGTLKSQGPRSPVPKDLLCPLKADPVPEGSRVNREAEQCSEIALHSMASQLQRGRLEGKAQALCWPLSRTLALPSSSQMDREGQTLWFWRSFALGKETHKARRQTESQ